MPIAKQNSARNTRATNKKTTTATRKQSTISTASTSVRAKSMKKSPQQGKLGTNLPTGTAISRGQIKRNGLSNSAIMGLLHLVGGVLGSRGWLAVIIYYIIKKESFTTQDIDIFYNIVNFNLSFLLYAIIGALLVVILIGIPLLAVVSVCYIVLLIVSSFHYISDKPYTIPFSIQILK